MIKCSFKNRLTFKNTPLNFQYGTARWFLSNQGVSVKLVRRKKQEWQNQIKTAFKTRKIELDGLVQGETTTPSSFFNGIEKSKENLLTSILMTQHHLAAGKCGLKIPVCCSEGGIQLQLRYPVTVRQDALTLATTRPLGWDVPGCECE